jgi:hypothetical protein
VHCKIGRRGSLSGLVVVRTVVSAQGSPLPQWDIGARLAFRMGEPEL